MAYQLPLAIKLNDSATFENFVVTGNEQLIELLPSHEPYIYAWAHEAVGKTHLLQALCQQQPNAIYLPLDQYRQWQPEIFSGLENFELICLDDVQHLAGLQEWEQALFNLFNRVRDAGRQLRITASASVASIPFRLKDLSSRLAWGISMQVQALTDEDKVRALSMRAGQKGFKLESDVGAYLLKNCPRDMASLFHILQQLDDASIQAQRRITIPFIKKCLGL